MGYNSLVVDNHHPTETSSLPMIKYIQESPKSAPGGGPGRQLSFSSSKLIVEKNNLSTDDNQEKPITIKPITIKHGNALSSENTTPPTGCKKRVSFGGTRTQIFYRYQNKHSGNNSLNESLHNDEGGVLGNEELWYTRNDLARFKMQYAQDSKTVLSCRSKSIDAAKKALRQAFQTFCSGRNSLVPSHELQIQEYLETQVYLRGLERMATIEILADRRTRRRALVEQVLGIQCRLRYQRDRCGAEVDNNETSLLFRHACEEISFVSARYAHQIAQITAVAITTESAALDGNNR